MTDKKLSWEEMLAVEPDFIGIENKIKKIIKRAQEEERNKIYKRVKNLISKMNTKIANNFTSEHWFFS